MFSNTLGTISYFSISEIKQCAQSKLQQTDFVCLLVLEGESLMAEGRQQAWGLQCQESIHILTCRKQAEWCTSSRRPRLLIVLQQHCQMPELTEDDAIQTTKGTLLSSPVGWFIWSLNLGISISNFVQSMVLLEHWLRMINARSQLAFLIDVCVKCSHCVCYD